tara:strand:- start:13959 stop:14636 length:678 start_codon:yes stop_codon:yes gene_type:complete
MAFPLGLVLGIAATGASFAASSSAAAATNRHRRELAIRRNEQYRRNVQHQKDMMEFYTERYEATASAAIQDAEQQYNTVYEAIGQRRKQAAATVDSYSRQALSASSTYRNKYSSTTGQSKALALNQFSRLEAEAAAVVHDNFEGNMRQSQRQFNAIAAQTQNRINQAMPQPMQPLYPGDSIQGVREPGGFDLALGIANQVASSYGNAAQNAPDGSSFTDIIKRMV